MSAELTLTPGNWQPHIHRRLQRLLRERGRRSPAYRPSSPPYAVFDWDNTSIFLDVEEATITYQLLHLQLAVDPEQLQSWLSLGVPDQPFVAPFTAITGEPVTIEAVAADVVDSYRWLYSRRLQPLEERQRSPHYLNFISKLRFLYDAIDASYGAAVSNLWITYFFTGMNETEVEALVGEAIEWQLGQPIEACQWVSPAELAGRSGVLRAPWRNGLRLLPEMQDLYEKLRRNGFDIWICTASLRPALLAPACQARFGYHQPRERIIGIELDASAEGRLCCSARPGYELTFGLGKSHAIRRRLVSHYGYGPLLVAGDSEGDQDMLRDFADSQVSLMIDRGARPHTPLATLHEFAREQHKDPDARYLLQRRCEQTGRFLSLDPE